MALKIHAIFCLLILQFFASSCLSQQEDFDFFYLVQQWPPAYCDTKTSCCFPTTGKPAENFTIHGLWPNRDDGSYPQNCKLENAFNETKVTDLLGKMQEEWPTLACPSGDGVKFWTHEWEKHGTCTVLNEHQYFQTTLYLKEKTNFLKVLNDSGIVPKNGVFYNLTSIREAIQTGIGYRPWIQCNKDTSEQFQLYQVYLCVDKSASNFIECPVFPHENCGKQIEFPSFSSEE